MATTLSVILVHSGVAKVGHVGDTRIYHFRDSGVVTRTQDQTEVAGLLREKVLSPSQARVYPRRNVITSYLSSSSDFDLFESKFEVKTGDVLMLLTDGMYGLIKKAEMLDLVAASTSMDALTSSLRERLESLRMKDDSTVIAIRA